jgi:5-methylcytosine-specific restriction endonuclease McrA
MRYQWNTCWYCGRRLIFSKKDSPRQRTVDHVVPESAGGDKFVDSCKACNNKKGNSSLEEYREWMGVESFYGEERGWMPW